MRERRIAQGSALLAMLWLTVLLAGCGGADSATSGTESSAESSNASATETGTAEPADSETQTTTSEARAPESAIEAAAPSSNPLIGPVRLIDNASKIFRQPGDENRLPYYGKEGSRSQLRSAAVTMHAYLAAQTEGDWQAACNYLSQKTVEFVERLASQYPKLKGKACPEDLRSLLKRVSGKPGPLTSEVAAGSIRVGPYRAYLLYRAGKRRFVIIMEPEDGLWQVGSI